MHKIIVTGGAGYIGSHTVVSLINSGFEPIVVDDFSNSQRDSIERIEKIVGQSIRFYEANTADINSFERVFAENEQIAGIIHFAAFKAVKESVDKPLMYYKNNLVSLLNCIELSEKYKVKNLVFSSSATVYGNPAELPVSEQTPTQRPSSPYGNTKKIGEEILEDYCKANPDFNAIILRYFNPIGAHASGLIGELPNGVPNNLMPFITQTAYGLREKLSVFGNDYDTADGTALRDYVHVEDVADAHVLTLQRLVNQNNTENYEFYNLGTGKGTSVIEIIAAFEKVNNLKLNFTFEPRRAGDVPELFASTKKANEILKFKSKKSLEDMARSAWKWEKGFRDAQKKIK